MSHTSASSAEHDNANNYDSDVRDDGHDADVAIVSTDVTARLAKELDETKQKLERALRVNEYLENYVRSVERLTRRLRGLPLANVDLPLHDDADTTAEVVVRTRQCRDCKQTLSLDNFTKNKLSCKPCVNAKQKARYRQQKQLIESARITNAAIEIIKNRTLEVARK
jgi:hypothetical protein